MATHRAAYLWRLALIAVCAVASNGQSATRPAAPQQWAGTWAASPMLADGGFAMRPLSGITLREIAHISAGGAQIRIRFSNEFGVDPLTIRDAHAAISAGGATIQEGTDHAVTFAGEPGISIPPGAAIFSDPVGMAVTPLADVAVSFYLPAQVMRSETYHALAQQDNYLAEGDVAGTLDLPLNTKVTSWYFFNGIDVKAEEGSRAIVTLGDSITDGARSTLNTNRRWPNLLAARLVQDKKLSHISVLNEGISGNRVLNNVAGPNALARINRDVLSQDGVRYLIVLAGINDIGHIVAPITPFDDITVQQLEFGLRQIADAAHEHGIKAIGATLTPYKGAPYYSEKGEQIRQALNDWIRTSGIFDAVIYFDKTTRDTKDPLTFNPQYDSGDHLHPNDAGYAAMAAAVDLGLFAN